MTAEPQTAYSAPPPVWQQPASAEPTPSGLGQAFAGVPPVPPPAPAPAPSFSGYAGDAPSGLARTAYAEPAPASVYAEPEPASVYAEPAPGPVYAEPAPVSFYAEPAPGSIYAEPAPAYVPETPAYAPPPQAAYPEMSPAFPAPAPAEPGPGYLTPFPPPEGFSGRGPGVAPVVVFTLFFGVFGMISAQRRAKRAEAVGDSPGKYWMAFGVTLSIGWVVGAIATILALVGAGIFAAATTSAAAPVHTITAAELSQSMVAQGTFAGKNGKPVRIKAATCAPTGVDAHGAGDYRCAVGLTDGTKANLTVRAGTSGWRILGKAK